MCARITEAQMTNKQLLLFKYGCRVFKTKVNFLDLSKATLLKIKKKILIKLTLK